MISLRLQRKKLRYPIARGAALAHGALQRQCVHTAAVHDPGAAVKPVPSILPCALQN
jgi:hypothetical protein